MAFMVPQYRHENFATITDHRGESYSLPFEDLDLSDIANHDVDVDVTIHAVGWWARLSAPGYRDATEWAGPFETEQEARAHVRETYGVDDESGDDLVD